MKRAHKQVVAYRCWIRTATSRTLHISRSIGLSIPMLMGCAWPRAVPLLHSRTRGSATGTCIWHASERRTMLLDFDREPLDYQCRC